MMIDLDIIGSLAEQIEEQEVDRNARSIEASTAAPALIDAIGRYLSLPGGSAEATVMIPLLRQEIHFRLLTSPPGGMLRNLLLPGGHAAKIARAIKLIHAGYRESLALPPLADFVAMSPSSFHAHFKAITGTTPLQYQKDLRLIEAKQLLSGGVYNVTAAAFMVGYESASQFSRDYTRKFGGSPRQDLKANKLLDS